MIAALATLLKKARNASAAAHIYSRQNRQLFS
jgi:hypothetical protein